MADQETATGQLPDCSRRGARGHHLDHGSHDEETIALGGPVRPISYGEPISEPRVVLLRRAVVMTVALMFLAGAGVNAWDARRGEQPAEADVGFADDMTSHYLQGVELAFAYLESGTDDFLRHVAREIITVQAGEARLLQAQMDWWDAEPSPDEALGWMGTPVPQDEQPGMASGDDLAALRAATGTDLDDLYSRLMIEHHAGGVSIADGALEDGRHPDIQVLAGTIRRVLEVEMDGLNQRRLELGLPQLQPEIDAD